MDIIHYCYVFGFLGRGGPYPKIVEPLREDCVNDVLLYGHGARYIFFYHLTRIHTQMCEREEVSIFEEGICIFLILPSVGEGNW